MTPQTNAPAGFVYWGPLVVPANNAPAAPPAPPPPPPFTVTMADFLNAPGQPSTVFVSAEINGVTYQSSIAWNLCATLSAALGLWQRLNTLKGVQAKLVMVDPLFLSSNGPFSVNQFVPGFEMIAANGSVIETTTAGDLLVYYMQFNDVYADSLMEEWYG